MVPLVTKGAIWGPVTLDQACRINPCGGALPKRDSGLRVCANRPPESRSFLYELRKDRDSERLAKAREGLAVQNVRSG